MIIGISGKKQSGKDTIAKIINYLTTGGRNTYIGDTEEEAIKGFIEYYDDGIEMYPFQNKKFADKLKDIICLLIGCTRDQLEDEKFKNTPLGEEWDRWILYTPNIYGGPDLVQFDKLFNSEKEAFYYNKNNLFYSPNTIKIELEKMTPRKLLQLLGTECGRQIIHPNIWVNSTMSDYVPYSARGSQYEFTESKWIITDVRFPNEVEAIKKRNGINIRVERFCYDSLEDFLVCYPNKEVSKKAIKVVAKADSNPELFKGLEAIPESKEYIPLKNQHLSETALDNYKDWDYIIENISSFENLIEKVKDILIKEGII